MEVHFCIEEIKEVTRESDSNKSLGPDGFYMRFFKVSWNTIKKDLVVCMNQFYALLNCLKQLLQVSFL